MFSFELCMALGGMTHKEMMSKMDNLELMKWVAVNNISPFGYKRTDINAAFICSKLHNVFYSKHSTPEDFMPDFSPDTTEQVQSDDDMKAVLNKLMNPN